MPAPVTAAMMKATMSAMIRSAGSIGSFTGCPLIMMVPPEVRSLKLSGLNRRNDPYSAAKVRTAKAANAAAWKLSVLQKIAE